MSQDPPKEAAGGVLLMKTWSDGEAEVVRHLLATYGIECQVVSDVPHMLFPLSVDGLGEIRILIAPEDREEAENVLAEHRRQGMELVSGGLEGSEEPPEGSQP